MRRLTVTMPALAVVAVAIWVLGTGKPAFGQLPCTPQDLDHPIEMNTVVVRNLVKTIKVEKEIFFCDTNADGVPDRIVDLQIFTKIAERIRPALAVGAPPITQFPIVSKTFEVVTCVKDIADPTAVKCQSEEPPASLPVQPPPQNVPPRPVPKDPIEMNTVVVGNIIKTVKAQKEVFLEPPPLTGGSGFILDVETFTEIFEKVVGPQQIPRTVAKRVEVAVCKKEVPPVPGALPQVLGCVFQPPQVLVGGSEASSSSIDE